MRMINFKEILRMNSSGEYSQNEIVLSLHVSRNIVARCIASAIAQGDWVSGAGMKSLHHCSNSQLTGLCSKETSWQTATWQFRLQCSVFCLFHSCLSIWWISTFRCKWPLQNLQSQTQQQKYQQVHQADSSARSTVSPAKSPQARKTRGAPIRARNIRCILKPNSNRRQNALPACSISLQLAQSRWRLRTLVRTAQRDVYEQHWNITTGSRPFAGGCRSAERVVKDNSGLHQLIYWRWENTERRIQDI